MIQPFSWLVEDNHFVHVCVLQKFASMSGLNINVDKTKAVWVGSRRNSRWRFMPEINLDWNPVTFKVQGVVFSTDVPERVKIILKTS